MSAETSAMPSGTCSVQAARQAQSPSAQPAKHAASAPQLVPSAQCESSEQQAPSMQASQPARLGSAGSSQYVPHAGVEPPPPEELVELLLELELELLELSAVPLLEELLVELAAPPFPGLRALRPPQAANAALATSAPAIQILIVTGYPRAAQKTTGGPARSRPWSGYVTDREISCTRRSRRRSWPRGCRGNP
jgi:hypothetical protein